MQHHHHHHKKHRDFSGEKFQPLGESEHLCAADSEVKRHSLAMSSHDGLPVGVTSY